MEYFTTFLWGLASFLSPCMLPMMPLYLSYFSKEQGKEGKAFLLSVSFVLGFTAVFCVLGLFIGSLGALFFNFHEVVEMIGGIIIILLGLNALGLFHFPHGKERHNCPEIAGLASSFLFGVVFSASHIPCVGAFLGTALATAGVSGSICKSVLMLGSYSLGMGVPFLICAVMIEKLEPFIQKVKKNHHGISAFCGGLLILLGILMASGLLHKLFHI